MANRCLRAECRQTRQIRVPGHPAWSGLRGGPATGTPPPPNARISLRLPRDRSSPPQSRSRSTSIRTGSVIRSWGSGLTGVPRRCRCSATGTPGSFTSKGHPQYKDHLEHYGHPTKVGYKDMIPLWKAEKWDPDRLMGLYKKAGARYFVSMGVHHDNFDLWNSTHHKWNAVKMGPHRDVVGDWQKAAKKLGLRFGVSEHLGASFTWFQDSHRSDKTGPLAGVPYDGADPKYQDLYHWPASPGDTGWYSKDPRWHREWFARIKDLVDQYHPDLLYTDGGAPFGNEVGLSLIAHHYNASAGRNGGKTDVVYTCKEKSEGKWVEDLERGVMPGIRPYPWQTDTSIGDWYYNRNWKYRGADWVIHMLVDIVSKNGNLLINVVQRPDGSLDPEPEQILAEMARWIAINGEGIYETRPWLIHGEGPVRAKGGHFKEDFAYTAK